jgi:hypothetical protein
MMSIDNINPAIRQPSPKSSLMGLGKLSTTDDIHTKAVKMNVVALNHANHHPAKRFEVTSILPHDVTLTQKIIQRIIEPI